LIPFEIPFNFEEKRSQIISTFRTDLLKEDLKNLKRISKGIKIKKFYESLISKTI
jgi:hypothetical protein